jgi:hypothetical protein
MTSPYGSLRQRSPNPRPYLDRVRDERGDRYRFMALSGEDWGIHDFRLADGRRRRLTLGSKQAQYRAFVPKAGTPIRVYKFREGDKRMPEVFELERQLQAAEYLGTTKRFEGIDSPV